MRTTLILSFFSSALENTPPSRVRHSIEVKKQRIRISSYQAFISTSIPIPLIPDWLGLLKSNPSNPLAGRVPIGQGLKLSTNFHPLVVVVVEAFKVEFGMAEFEEMAKEEDSRVFDRAA